MSLEEVHHDVTIHIPKEHDGTHHLRQLPLKPTPVKWNFEWFLRKNIMTTNCFGSRCRDVNWLDTILLQVYPDHIFSAIFLAECNAVSPSAIQNRPLCAHGYHMYGSACPMAAKWLANSASRLASASSERSPSRMCCLAPPSHQAVAAQMAFQASSCPGS